MSQPHVTGQVRLGIIGFGAQGSVYAKFIADGLVPQMVIGAVADIDADRREEAAALRLGLDLGLSLIDTAEMYAEGGAEEVVAEAIAGRREEVFLVSKVYPHNAGGRKLEAALERSLQRLFG